MAQQIVNTGTVGNDGTGDDLRTGATKINANFTEIYSNITALSLQLNLATVNSNGVGFGFNGILFDGATKDSFTTVTRLVPEDTSQVNIVTIPDSTGTIALLSDINRDTVLGVKGAGTKLLDSAAAIKAMFDRGFIDSARMVRITLDSADVTAYIDSAYVQLRQNGGLDSAKATALFLLPVQVDSAFDSNFARDIASRDVRLDALDSAVNAITNFTTDNVLEDSAQSNGGAGPTNLYYTTARVDSDIDARVDLGFINNLNVDAETLGGQTLAQLQSSFTDATEVQAQIDSNFDHVNRDFVPHVNETYDLGTSTKRWKDLHLSGTTIFLGGGELRYENSEFRFGGGTLGVNDALVLDSGQRLFFDSDLGAPNITKSNKIQVNGLTINANALALRTTDDVDNDWFVRTNTPVGGTMSRFGEGGLVMLPHNTDTERTQYRTNAFYSDTFRKGAMHYNTDQNKFEFADSNGWFSIDSAASYAATAAAAATNAQYLQFGLNGVLSGAGSATGILGANGADVLTGVVMPVAGTVTHMTVSSQTNSFAGGSLTHSAALYKNNSYQSGISVEVTSAGAVGLSGTFNTTFAAGDRLKVTLDNDTGLDTEDHIVIVRFVES
jgi:hypothetical protein